MRAVSLAEKGRTLLDEQFTQHSDDLADVITKLPEQLRNTLRCTLSDVLTHLSPEKVTS